MTMFRNFLLAFLATFFILSCDDSDQISEKNIAVVEGYINAVQKLDYELMDNFLSDDYIGYGPSVADSILKTSASDQWKKNVESLYRRIEYKSSRNIAVSIPDGENQGDWVSNWSLLEITFKEGPQTVTIWANTVYKIEDDKISRSYTFYNEADALEQLGYVFINPDNL